MLKSKITPHCKRRILKVKEKTKVENKVLNQSHRNIYENLTKREREWMNRSEIYHVTENGFTVPLLPMMAFPLFYTNQISIHIKNWHLTPFMISNLTSVRLEIIPPKIVNLDQLALLKKGKQRKMYWMRYVICSQKEQAIILGLDAQKSFDSVEWGFLQEVLFVFNFNDVFVKPIIALYQNSTAPIKINGGLSNSFIIERGCRQGCPISPLLFFCWL